jgi:ERO1-like protein alpha
MATDMEENTFELDGWARWDMPSEDYYDLNQFPEGYTNFDGSLVWRFIHDRICFADYEQYDNHWKADFNKAVSGIHSMISAQVIRGIHEKVDSGEVFTAAEKWTDPSVEFKRRLGPDGETPLALENLYFCFMLLLSAVSKARSRLMHDCDSGKIDAASGIALRPVLALPIFDDPAVHAASLKLRDHAVKDSDSRNTLWEARMRSRELLRIMNCVQCNKCRLHGKISMMGFSTALQLLLGETGEGAEDTDSIHRVELATLMTTLHKFSRAIQFCRTMQRG